MKRPVIAGNDAAEIQEAQNEPAILDRTKISIGRLDRLEDVRREMASIFRHVRRGKLPSQEGTRLIYMLDRLAHTIEISEIERRLFELENYYGHNRKR